MSQITVILKSGRQLGPLSMNGGMYVSPVEITKADLRDEELERVSILELPDEGSAVETMLHDAVCDTVQHGDYGWMFNLRERTELEKLRAENEMLTECLLEISEILYGESTDFAVP